jgi:hypothetical protein
MNARKTLVGLGLGLAVLIVVYLGLLIVLIVWHPAEMDEWFRPRSCMAFSKMRWASTKFGDVDRYRMANDLVRSRLLLSLSEAEVRALLGEPTGVDQVGDVRWLGYELVHQRHFPAKCFLVPSFLFMNTDTWLLQVRCEKGRVKAVGIRFT